MEINNSNARQNLSVLKALGILLVVGLLCMLPFRLWFWVVLGLLKRLLYLDPGGSYFVLVLLVPINSYFRRKITYLENIKMTMMLAVPELSTITLDHVQTHPKRPSKSLMIQTIPC